MIHVLRTTGYYVGQVRRIGCRTWRTVTGKHTHPESAFAVAAHKMEREDKRVRVLLIPTGDTGSYYGPSIMMEGKRT